VPLEFRLPKSKSDWRDRPVLSKEIKRPTDNLQHVFPGVLMFGAVAFVLLGLLMSLATHRTDAQVNTLRARGVPVTYIVSTCANGRISSLCTGRFTYDQHTYDDSLSGAQHRPHSGSHVAALIDPKNPSAYVYERTAVLGHRSIGHNPWYVGGLVSLVLALILGTFGARLELRRRRQLSRLSRK
jgi:hypothetical protein